MSNLKYRKTTLFAIVQLVCCVGNSSGCMASTASKVNIDNMDFVEGLILSFNGTP